MALVLADRVRETTTVTGTGTATLLGAAPGYQSFSAVGNANTTYYVIANQSATEWEVGIGTYTSSGTTLSRNTVLASSNSGSLVNFSAGTKDVFVDYPAGRAVYEDAAGNVDGYPITGGTINNTTIGATTPAAGTFTTLTAQNETLKGTGQNLVPHSQTFTSWQKDGLTLTNNTTTAPDGTSTASTIIENSATSAHQVFYNNVVLTTTTYTFSVYAKANTRNWIKVSADNGSTKGVYFDVSSGTVGTADSGYTGTILSVGSGWYRCSIVFTAASTGSYYPDVILASANGTIIYTGNGTSGLFIWGAQFEIGSTANTYIPTTTTAVYGTPTLSFSGVASIGLQSDGSLYETSAGTGNVRFYTNNIGQEQARVSHTASAVNYIQVTGATTGNDSTISAQGSDANTGLIFLTKGSTGLTFRTRGGGTARNAFVMVDNGASSVNYLTSSSNVASSAPSLSATGSDTNIPLVLQPKGTGALQAQQTDSTATGGNARGANAVDWQTSRTAASQVANGSAAVIGGGQNNVASVLNATVGGGLENRVSGGYGTISGGYNNSVSGGGFNFLGGGNSNTNNGTTSVLVGGSTNSSSGLYNFVGGGFTNSATSASAVTTQSATMNGTTAVTLSGSNASIKVGQYISGTSIAGDTYVAAISGTSLTLSKVASGSSTSTLSFYTPHGVVVGGGNNQATGSYSFIGGGGDAGTAANRNVASGDWSTVSGGIRNQATGYGAIVCGGADPFFGAGNVASGQASSILGAANNTASGYQSSVLGGTANTANGDASRASGLYAWTRGIVGAFANGYNGFGSFAGGTCQYVTYLLQAGTTDATPKVATANGSTASTTNQVILPNNSAYFFTGEVIAGVTGGGNTKGWTIEGVIKRGANAASTALVGTPTVTSTYADAGASTWVIAVTADTTNGGLAVTFTGQASTTIRTVAQIRTTEMTY